MKRSTGIAVAAAALVAGCSGAEKGTTSRDRADAVASDGSRIAYQAFTNGWYCPCDYSTGGACDAGCYEYQKADVRLASSDGTDLGPVPGTLSSQSPTPAWSPDGTRIACVEGGSPEIHVVELATGIDRNLTSLSGPSYWSPTWSPDGTQIAYGSDADGATAVYVMNAADGSGVRRVTGSGAGVMFNRRIDWSRNGSTIAFDCIVEQGNVDVCTIKADGTGFVRLTTAYGWDSGAAWSPDGRLAFVRSMYGDSGQLFVMNADGTGVSRIGAGVTGDHPTWSPDGTRLAFHDWDASCPSSSCIYTVRVDGTDRTMIASAASADGSETGALNAAWSR
jgi:TolB protein